MIGLVTRLGKFIRKPNLNEVAPALKKSQRSDIKKLQFRTFKLPKFRDLNIASPL